MSIPASTTCLGCISWIYLDHPTTSLCRFIVKQIKEHRPCCISNALVNTPKITFSHIVNGQIFHTYSIELINYLSGFLMSKIKAFTSDSFIYPSNNFMSLCPRLIPLLLCRKFSLGFRESFLFLSEKSWIGDFTSIGESSKSFKPHVNTNDRLSGFLNRIMINLTGKRYKPFARWGTTNSASFDLTLDRPMKFNLNLTYLGKFNYIFTNLKPRLRVGEAIISPPTLKTRIPRLFFATFYSTEKGLKSKVNTCGNILKNLTMNIGQKGILLLQHFQCITLGVIRDTLLFRIPNTSTLFKKMIIKPAASIQHPFKELGLSSIGKNSVLECLSHTLYVSRQLA